MRVLGIETSGDHSSVALVEDGQLVAERFFPSRMSLCQTLAGHIQSVTECDRLSEASLDAVAVSLGPGSFTGLRMGVAMAKAVAHASGLALVGVPTHEALAWPLSFGGPTTVCVVQHARKDDVYVSLFRVPADRPGAPLVALVPCAVVSVADLCSLLDNTAPPILVVGDGGERYREAMVAALGERVRFAPGVLNAPRAAVVAAMAADRVSEADPHAAVTLRPLYALASQAERTHGVDLDMSGTSREGSARP